MLIRKWRGMIAAAAIALPLMAHAGDLATNSDSRMEVLRHQLQATLTERDVALHDLAVRHDAAKAEDRTTLEKQSAEMQTDFERQYLQLLVDYHALSGNTEAKAQAQRMLDVLDGVPVAPQEHTEIPNATNGLEGVTSHAE
jgi:hypothetical protein